MKLKAQESLDKVRYNMFTSFCNKDKSKSMKKACKLCREENRESQCCKELDNIQEALDFIKGGMKK